MIEAARGHPRWLPPRGTVKPARPSPGGDPSLIPIFPSGGRESFKLNNSVLASYVVSRCRRGYLDAAGTRLLQGTGCPHWHGHHQGARMWSIVNETFAAQDVGPQRRRSGQAFSFEWQFGRRWVGVAEDGKYHGPGRGPARSLPCICRCRQTEQSEHDFSWCGRQAGHRSEMGVGPLQRILKRYIAPNLSVTVQKLGPMPLADVLFPARGRRTAGVGRHGSAVRRWLGGKRGIFRHGSVTQREPTDEGNWGIRMALGRAARTQGDERCGGDGPNSAGSGGGDRQLGLPVGASFATRLAENRLCIRPNPRDPVCPWAGAVGTGR